MKLNLHSKRNTEKSYSVVSNHSMLWVAWSLFIVMANVTAVEILKLPETFTWIVQISIIIVILKNVRFIIRRRKIDKVSYYIILSFIMYLILEVIRGMYYAESYWVWKVTFRQLLIALFYTVILLATNVHIIQYYYRIYWKCSLFFIAICFIINHSPLLFNYLPFSTLLLFIPLIPVKNRWMLFSIVIVYFYFNYQRNDLIKISISFLIGSYIMLFYNIIPRKAIKLVHICFLIIPFIFLGLGSFGVFNIFKMDDYIKGSYTIKVETAEGINNESLTTDTRTFIYRNVYSTIKKYDDWLIGRSPAFGDEGIGSTYGKDDTNGLIGRYGNEVGIMDIFLWYGAIGVILYFLIYLRVTYLAIYESNNKYSKGIGLYVSFLWMWSFVWEKPLFETFFMIDLILLGLCLSTGFRQMSDAEVKTWVKGIFLRKRKSKVYKITKHEGSLDIECNISRSL